MITEIYPTYLQKSFLFLYPQLGIHPGARYKPVQTYTGLNNDIHPASSALILKYKKYKSDSFYKFETNYLISDSHFMERFESDKYYVYVFNMSHLVNSYDHFINGRYSRLSEEIKIPILDYFSKGDPLTEYIESYLYPELYYDEYSTILDVNQLELEGVIELCDKPDLNKETLTLQLNF